MLEQSLGDDRTLPRTVRVRDPHEPTRFSRRRTARSHVPAHIHERPADAASG